MSIASQDIGARSPVQLAVDEAQAGELDRDIGQRRERAHPFAPLLPSPGTAMPVWLMMTGTCGMLRDQSRKPRKLRRDRPGRSKRQADICRAMPKPALPLLRPASRRAAYRCGSGSACQLTIWRMPRTFGCAAAWALEQCLDARIVERAKATIALGMPARSCLSLEPFGLGSACSGSAPASTWTMPRTSHFASAR
jgi:hypothetical protein